MSASLYRINNSNPLNLPVSEGWSCFGDLSKKEKGVVCVRRIGARFLPIKNTDFKNFLISFLQKEGIDPGDAPDNAFRSYYDTLTPVMRAELIEKLRWQGGSAFDYFVCLSLADDEKLRLSCGQSTRPKKEFFINDLYQQAVRATLHFFRLEYTDSREACIDRLNSFFAASPEKNRVQIENHLLRWVLCEGNNENGKNFCDQQLEKWKRHSQELSEGIISPDEIDELSDFIISDSSKTKFPVPCNVCRQISDDSYIDKDGMLIFHDKNTGEHTSVSIPYDQIDTVKEALKNSERLSFNIMPDTVTFGANEMSPGDVRVSGAVIDMKQKGKNIYDMTMLIPMFNEHDYQLVTLTDLRVDDHYFLKSIHVNIDSAKNLVQRLFEPDMVVRALALEKLQQMKTHIVAGSPMGTDICIIKDDKYGQKYKIDSWDMLNLKKYDGIACKHKLFASCTVVINENSSLKREDNNWYVFSSGKVKFAIHVFDPSFAALYSAINSQHPVSVQLNIGQYDETPLCQFDELAATQPDCTRLVGIPTFLRDIDDGRTQFAMNDVIVTCCLSQEDKKELLQAEKEMTLTFQGVILPDFSKEEISLDCKATATLTIMQDNEQEMTFD